MGILVRPEKLFVVAVAVLFGAGSASNAQHFWLETADMPKAVQEIYPVVLENRIFVVGGFGTFGAVSDTMVYDMESKSWATGQIASFLHLCAGN